MSALACTLTQRKGNITMDVENLDAERARRPIRFRVRKSKVMCWDRHTFAVNMPTWIPESDDRKSRIGLLLYISSVQYFLIQLLVAIRWSPPYSLSRNTISGLGNTTCGVFNGRLVCSPLHTVMNVSFVVLGVTMMVGSVLVGSAHSTRRGDKVGFTFVGIGGFGVIFVGLFPENSVSAIHATASALPFVVGNIGVLTLGLSLELPARVRIFTVLAGVIALVALAFYAGSHYVGLGEGGLERFVAYPQTLWLIVFGAYFAFGAQKLPFVQRSLVD